MLQPNYTQGNLIGLRRGGRCVTSAVWGLHLLGHRPCRKPIIRVKALKEREREREIIIFFVWGKNKDK